MSHSMRASDLIAYFTAHLGVSGEVDLLYYYLEEGLKLIHEQPWPWNWASRHELTLKPEEQVGATYTWVQGQSYITSSAVVTLSYSYTGRKVKLGDEVYRCVDFGMNNVNRIYVDRPILGSQATGVALTFYRDEVGVQTTRVRTVEVNRLKIPRYSPQYFRDHFWGLNDFTVNTGQPRAYVDEDWHRIPPPRFPPVCVNGAASATPSAGTYVYFYTRREKETGLESPPGPSTTFVANGANTVRVTYGNTTIADQSEDSTYELRLYRSEKNPTRDRTPMFLVGARTPFALGAPFEDNTDTIYSLEPYYDGPFAKLRLIPGADSEYSVLVDHLHNYGFRPHGNSYVELGTNNQVLELLRMFFIGCVNVSTRNLEEYRKAVIMFRQQMNYLATQARSAGDHDQGPENHYYDVPGDDGGDWVDVLPWKE